MSTARPIIPGTRYMVTRRVTQRQFLLRPSALTNAIIAYCLAEAALATGVVIHAFVAMSNHFHAVVTDPHGQLPKFLHRLDRHIACCLNASLGRRENFWSSDGASAIALDSDDDVINQIAYTLANPTAAGLVEDPTEWPGVITTLEGITRTTSRPAVFFRTKGAMPETVELRVVPPELESCADAAAVRARLEERLDDELRLAREEVAARGETFIGRDAVLSVSPLTKATTLEARQVKRPRFIARDRKRRQEMIERLRAFHAQYTRALDAWRGGNRSARFPAGTYLMRVVHGALVDANPHCPDPMAADRLGGRSPPVRVEIRTACRM